MAVGLVRVLRLCLVILGGCLCPWVSGCSAYYLCVCVYHVCVLCVCLQHMYVCINIGFTMVLCSFPLIFCVWVGSSSVCVYGKELNVTRRVFPK